MLANNVSKSGNSLSKLQGELHQLDIETFEIEDLLTLDQNGVTLPVQSCSSCNTCFTTSCCSSSCSTTVTL